MDILSISSKMMSGLLSKILTKAIKKNLELNCIVEVNDVKISTDEGRIRCHLNVDGVVGAKDLQEFLKKNDII